MFGWSGLEDLFFRVDLLTTMVFTQQTMILYLIILIRRN